ncbi:TonB-dependent receptor [Novosphingobium lentum]|uniref:TonB-dependent receptor n=1 Tax=Novosphingobium lentum TaxID=145287 RepID=UPI00082EB201|nr:TonB-dependent receptor [Novosphingobium lentum]
MIVVTGRAFSPDADPITAPVVLSGDALVRSANPQIGEMLARLPGVTTSGFAPGASRPILRGLDGARVPVLLDGIGALDASAVSADHAVALDTLNIDRIDVLHGPEVLLYASDPAAGAVNALDKRIPRAVPDKPFTLAAQGSYGTNADAWSAGATVDIRLAPRLVAHFDAGHDHSNNEDIGGFVISPQLRGQVLGDAAALRAAGNTPDADSLLAQANARGTLANSGARGTTLGAGLAFIDTGGNIGVSVERLTTTYGIPPRPEVGNADPVTIALRQTRVDLRAGLAVGGLIDRIEFRGAYGDYHHAELDAGVPATLFANKAIETRLEAIQSNRGGWRGKSGVQYGINDLAVTGDPLLPNTTTSHVAAFTLQQYRIGKLDLEAAGRFEHTGVTAKPNGLRRGFNQVSGVLGLALHPTDALTLSIDALHGERAPAAEELFIDGIHDATQSYERGNPLFAIERSNGIEGGLRYRSGGVLFAVTAYATNYANFITPVPTGQAIQGYPVYQFLQVPARFRGLEAEASTTVMRWGDRTLTIDGGGDYIHATLKGIGPVPRIPPLRLRGGVEYGSAALNLRGEVEWNAPQNRVAANENRVAAFTLVNASATWRPLGADSPLSLILSGDNLLNVSGRLAASETRDFVPIRGRDVKITASVRL